jgi:hypothetical protein
MVPPQNNNQKLLSQRDARMLIYCQAVQSMQDRAVRHVFGKPLGRATRAILEWIPTIGAVHGCAPTEKLVEVICKELGVEERQGHRYLKAAIDQGWVVPKPCNEDGRITDNQLAPDRDIPAKVEQLTKYFLAIAEVVAAQLKDPLDLTAGHNLIEQNVYVNPVARVLEKRKEIGR